MQSDNYVYCTVFVKVGGFQIQVSICWNIISIGLAPVEDDVHFFGHAFESGWTS